MSKKGWGIVGCALIVSVLLVIVYAEKTKIRPVPFLEQMSLDQVSFQAQWEQFRQRVGISEEARIENFHLIHDKNQNAYSIRFKVVDEVDDGFVIYTYRKCFSCSVEEEKNKDYIGRNVADSWIQYPRLIEAEHFFEKLDAGMRQEAIRPNKFAYYLITSSGESESIGLPGEYYRLNHSGLKKMKFESRPSADGFNLHIIGSNTPGPFSTEVDNTVHLIFY